MFSNRIVRAASQAMQRLNPTSAPTPSSAPVSRPSPAGIIGRAARSAISRMGPFKEGGKVSSASKRADGIAQRGKTKGKMI